MDIIVRDIEEKDFSEVFSLAEKSVKYQVSPLRENVDMNMARENFLNDLEVVKQNLPDRPNSRFLVAATEENKILGYLLMATDVCESTTGVEQGWIFDIALIDEYWNSAVPEKLVEKAEAITREKGLRHIALQLTCSHEKALKFFKEKGYEEERKRMYKRLPFDSVEYNRKRKEMLDALSGIKFKIKFPLY